MTDRSATFGSFTIHRTYAASPARVFAAWADAEAKNAWFGNSDKYEIQKQEFNFHIGGRDRLMGLWKSGMTTDFSSCYHDIVPNERIVYDYEMALNGVRISVSLATIEIKAHGSGSRLTLTEQAVFLDGFDDGGSRERGTNELIGMMEAALDLQPIAP
jgi:uncharacterized protein YndB with AHSA1/START domain